MKWVVFSYSLPSKSSSSPRVTLWRRLRRLGAVSPTGGTHVLPARADCVEAFQWLAQEVQHLGGQTLVMHVQQFEGLTEQQLINLFCSARKEDYSLIQQEAADLEKTLQGETGSVAQPQVQEALAKLQRQYADIVRIDYFNCPEKAVVEAQLARIIQALSPNAVRDAAIRPASIADYRNKRWVTRPQPYVDRLACAWLIRRFISPKAAIRYSLQPEPDEVPFDMSGAEFSHQGNLCTFETMIRAFGLQDPALQGIAEIVHEVDLRDGRYMRLEIPGIDAVLKGWLSVSLSDPEIELRGIALFEGLYSSLVGQQELSTKD
jgi:hypothetical protein